MDFWEGCFFFEVWVFLWGCGDVGGVEGSWEGNRWMCGMYGYRA